MEKYQLKARKRNIIGRKVKQLRKKGLLPANLYGNKIKSQAVETNLNDFKKIFRKAGETKIVDLVINDKDTHPVLIHNVQFDPVSGIPLHADFYQVNLKEKITTKIPVVLVGTSPAVIQKIGLLLQTLNEIEIEALPQNLPEKIEVDVSGLTSLDQEIKVSDLKVPAGVTILTDVGLGVVKVSKLISKEAEALAKEEAEEAAKAQAAQTQQTAAEATTAEKPTGKETGEKNTSSTQSKT